MTTFVSRTFSLFVTISTLLLTTNIGDGFVANVDTSFSISHDRKVSSPLLASVSTPSKKRKSKSMRSRKNNRSTNTKSVRGRGPGRTLTEDELSEHIASRYANVMTVDDNSNTLSSGKTMDDHKAFLKQLTGRPALVLNADFQPMSYIPLSLWSWQDSVKAVFSGKVQVVEVYPDTYVRAANFEVPLPSVIALSEYVHQKNNRPAFTRRNVFLRDEYKCQYCNSRFHTADLSLDHVHPRCMGGQLNWENAVTCCLKCNGRKGSMPVTQLRSIGMKLMQEPRCPSQMELAAKAARMVPRRVHPTWKPYLGIAESPNNTFEKGGDEEHIDDRYFQDAD